MGSFLLTLIAGVAAGAWTARVVVRKEIDALRATLVSERKPEPVQPAAPPPAPVAAEPPISEEISPEILMVLSAAVAAFCGKRAKIRRARLAGPAQGSAWAQQGRVFVQASHNLPHHH